MSDASTHSCKVTIVLYSLLSLLHVNLSSVPVTVSIRMGMYHDGDLQSGIAKAVQGGKPLLFFVAGIHS